MSVPEWRNASAPPWFNEMVALPARSHYVDVDGARIHYLSWNDAEREKPGLLFAHGFRGHARWWSFTAPALRDRFRVYALDLSGMGDSEGRASYDPLTFVRDIAGVLRHAEIAPATVVGHSFGGGRTFRLCAEHPELVARAIVVDSYVHFPSADVKRPTMSVGPRKLYESYEAAKARYRLLPPESNAPDYVVDYIAHHAIEAHGAGFRWKFADSLATSTLVEPDGPSILRRISVPLTYMHGALSRVADDGRAARIVSEIAGARGPIAIPEAHHHVMLDQPLALIAALRTALCA